jgi:hypothetical protein
MEVIASLINCLAAVTVAGAAIYGINTWRREFIGKRKIELAGDILALFYEAKNAIAAIRSGWQMQGEGTTRKAAENETTREKELKDRAYVVFERFKRNQGVFNKLYSLKFQFMAQFGQDSGKPFEEIKHIINTILVHAQALPELWAEQGLSSHPSQAQKRNEPKQQALEKQIKEYESSIWWTGKNDPIDTQVDKIISDIEQIHSEITGKNSK